ncbi:hypothetical protein BDQ17DRAFT_1362650 [Cyathus striatus]|nr:hypothetical protein BDQ17DRAFT_1362650 [Cyathus striatus]
MQASVLQEIQNICARSNNVSQLFRYGGEGYKNSISHYLQSSCDVAEFAVQPGTVSDLSQIMAVIARDRTPFAIKGGGHSSNPGFSSTTGIQISLTRLNNIEYIPSTQHLKVGAGCLFDEVYRALPPDRNIVGGSTTQGVGVAGFYLGGGYSLKTNQYGLGIDNIVSVQIVLPDGRITVASERENADLFVAVKGGGNNFGIATEFTLKTHYQPPKIHAGFLVYNEKQSDLVKNAIMTFIETCLDPKAAVVGAFRYSNNGIGVTQTKITIQYLYDDDPLPNPNPFAPFFNIPHLNWTGMSADSNPSERDRGHSDEDNSAMSYLEFEQRFALVSHPGKIDRYIQTKDGNGEERAPQAPPQMAGVGENGRGRWATAMLGRYTRAVIDKIETQSKGLSNYLKFYNGVAVTGEVWPFLPTIFNHSTPSAWPHPKGTVYGPQIITVIWNDESDDDLWTGQVQKAINGVIDTIHREGVVIPDVPFYCNTSDADMITSEHVYRNNYPMLRNTKKKYDPRGVMNLAGGFKIQ